MPLLCTSKLNWTRRTTWGWWDESDDTLLQTDTRFEIRRSDDKHATSRSQRLPTILNIDSRVDGWRGGGVRESGERVWQAVVIITTSRRYWNEIVEIHSSSLNLLVHVIYSGSNCKCHFPVSTLVEHWTFFSKLNLTKNRSVLCQSFVFWAIAVSICSGLTRQRDISLFKIPWSPRPRFRP